MSALTTRMLVLGAVIIAALVVPPSPQRGAFLICKQFVQEKLRSPTSATFPPYDEESVNPHVGGTYRVWSHVDSQNGFGAMVRTPYVCTVLPLGGTRYRLVDLKLEDPE